MLHGSGTQVDGVAFFGLGAAVPITPWDWSFDLSEEEAERMLATCPEGAVLVLHSPPKGYLDDGLGSEAIMRAILGGCETSGVVQRPVEVAWDWGTLADGATALWRSSRERRSARLIAPRRKR
jgi:hypothetical protein